LQVTFGDPREGSEGDFADSTIAIDGAESYEAIPPRSSCRQDHTQLEIFIY